MKPYRIILADDHAMVRKGIKTIIKECPNEDITVVGEASDGLALLDLLNEIEADLVVLDISMPKMRGVDAAAEISKRHPHIQTLILSMHKNLGIVKLALSNGAKGYLLKEDTDTELFEAIREVRDGRIYLSPLLAKEMAADLLNQSLSASLEREELTKREESVLRLIAEGNSTGEVADALCVSPNTVQNHRANIMRKLKAKNIAELTKYAFQKGYIMLDPE